MTATTTAQMLKMSDADYFAHDALNHSSLRWLIGDVELRDRPPVSSQRSQRVKHRDQKDVEVRPMKQAMINYRQDWTFWLPDSVANWDAISHWERERLASMERWLQPGMVLYDIGTEHGWLSAVYGSFCGHGHMVLVEPSPEFWPNIRLTWQHNGFTGPIACYVAFAGEELDGAPFSDVWPAESDGDEIGAMAYRYIGQHTGIPTVTVDWLARQAPPMRPPDAITVDVEGAELLVMRGAAETLTRYRTPFVWLSVHPDLMERDFGHTPDMLHAFMDERGYHGKLLAVDHEEHWLYRPRAS